MTDAEIIKAKAHFEYGIKCDIFSEPVLSYAETVLEAFDLINRQKAEIESLQNIKNSNIQNVLESFSNEAILCKKDNWFALNLEHPDLGKALKFCVDCLTKDARKQGDTE